MKICSRYFLRSSLVRLGIVDDDTLPEFKAFVEQLGFFVTSVQHIQADLAKSRTSFRQMMIIISPCSYLPLVGWGTKYLH